MDPDTIKGFGEMAIGSLVAGAGITALFYLFDPNSSYNINKAIRDRNRAIWGIHNAINNKEQINTKSSDIPQENNWYLWLNLTREENRDSFVENHHKLRNQFTEYGKKYEHLQVHDGDFDPLPKGVIYLATRSVQSSRYCMAKTAEQFKPELESLKNDLIIASLENRVIGPTNNTELIEQYGDNLEMVRLFARRDELLANR
jgi:hypothetical protein